MPDKKTRLKKLEEQIAALTKERNALEQEILAEQAEFKIGDVIRWGRKRQLRGRVESYEDFCSKVAYVVQRILKSGETSGRQRVYHWDNPEADK